MATVSDFVIHRLHRWGVRQIYGYPGDGINGFMGALDRQQHQMRFIQARHEELAAFMACAHAKFTGGAPGVCLATSGPGAIHLLNGLYDAAMDHQPVVALVGQARRVSMGADFQQEVDLTSLFKDVAHHFVHTCTTPAAARHLIDRAVRIAMAERTVTCVIFPSDVQDLPEVTSPPREHGATFSGVGWSPPRVLPHERDLLHAAQILNEGKKVAILVGQGAIAAGGLVRQVAERLGAGVAKTILGKPALPDHLPYVTGAIGLLGTRPSDYMMRNCDTLLMIGSSFPYADWLPAEGQARGVQIDVKPRMLSLRYPMERPLCGEAGETLRALLPLLEPKVDRSWQRTLEGEVEHWWKVLEQRAKVDGSAGLLNPQRVFWELSPMLPDRAVITADSGSVANWYARDIKIREGMMGSLSGNLATMGPGVPYALAAKLVHPDRPVIALVGDGAMQMLGMNSLITIADRWREWEDPRLLVLVLRNDDLNQVTWEQRALSGDPRFADSQDLPAFSFARFARQLGLEAVTLRRPEEIVPGWEHALRADRPVLVEAFTDPEVPPLPPHISREQAQNFLRSMRAGDAHRWRVVGQAAKELWATAKTR